MNSDGPEPVMRFDSQAHGSFLLSRAAANAPIPSLFITAHRCSSAFPSFFASERTRPPIPAPNRPTARRVRVTSDARAGTEPDQFQASAFPWPTRVTPPHRQDGFPSPPWPVCANVIA